MIENKKGRPLSLEEYGQSRQRGLAIVKLWKNDRETVREIGKRYGISGQRVQQILKQHLNRKPTKKLRPGDKLRIFEGCQDNWSDVDLAEVLILDLGIVQKTILGFSKNGWRYPIAKESA